MSHEEHGLFTPKREAHPAPFAKPGTLPTILRNTAFGPVLIPCLWQVAVGAIHAGEHGQDHRQVCRDFVVMQMMHLGEDQELRVRTIRGTTDDPVRMFLVQHVSADVPTEKTRLAFPAPFPNLPAGIGSVLTESQAVA